jgi:ABC-2 type transport system ATP-binding protein
MLETVIQTDALTRDFRALRAVDGLSIEVPRGTIFGFLGPNGSGKTTTIRMLLGILAPTSGQAKVLGFEVGRDSYEIRRRCGALLEHPGVYERLSAEDNLEFYGRVAGLPEPDRRERIKHVLRSLGLWDRRKDGAGTWSRGMKQKLAVARAILHRPEVIFLDEPTSGLDPVAAAGLREELAALVQREGITVFLTTHNLPEAEKLCTKVAIIHNGQLLAQGTPNEICAATGSKAVSLEEAFLTLVTAERKRDGAQPQAAEQHR